MTKSEKYDNLLKQVKSLLEGETDKLANWANVISAVHETFGFWWTGIYRVKGEELILGPFQGPVACTRIQRGKGVCGTAWESGETIVVANVHEFDGHIACSAESCSEIVIPHFSNGEVDFVFDIDSSEYNTFDQTDKRYLEKIIALL